ncbi:MULTISPECIES: ABC transporter permease [Brevibacillus]|nr:ABC transporter permease [Brevibacillus borstelensis]MCC0566101.1 ABC transporter permease [Brevibacillus borstelensis]MCM3472871.1 ABC transporter permease [Brevibacillus borstelensis]MCM3560815.1 ABC transporter permease [Brevibacillus borstelensis]MCM3592741.1 ABC transporter permease [Brevibacillus borstelensis]MCM3624384.1 ABC transporter permease [Brevibacillus borstelensis]
MSALFLLPLILILGVSFFTRSSFGGIELPLTVENYVRFFDPLYFKILWISCVLAFFTTAICLVLGYPFAYIVARSPINYRNILMLLIIVPFWTNSLIRTYAWIVLLRTEGVINTILMQLGIISQPLPLLYNETAVLIGLVYTMLPFMVLPLYASIEKLDKSLLEASSDLGAKPVHTFWKVTLPLTAPGIMAGSLLVFIPSLGLFFIPDLMGGSKTVLIGNLIKNQFLTARDWPFGSASSIILMGLTLLFITAYILITKDKEGKELL